MSVLRSINNVAVFVRVAEEHGIKPKDILAGSSIEMSEWDDPLRIITTAQENKKIPNYDYRKCIRCFCCIEFCPETAISLKKGKLQWLLRI